MGVRGFSVSAEIAGIDERLVLLREALPLATGEKQSDEEAKAAENAEQRNKALLLGAVSKLPGLIDDMDNVVARSLLPPLLFELRRLELERSRLLAEQRRTDRALELRRQIIAAMEKQNELVNQSRGMFQRAIACPPDPAMPLDPAASAMFQQLPHECREHVAAALLQYARAWTHGAIPRREAEHRLVALAHERTLGEAEHNLRAWNELISSPLSQLVAIYSGGITDEMITDVVVGVITAAGWAGAIAGAKAVSP
jgi:hypothetical protein